MLHRAGVFPKAGDPCLEVGFGWLGWLGNLLSWGVRERDLHGIDLNPAKVNRGRGCVASGRPPCGGRVPAPLGEQPVSAGYRFDAVHFAAGSKRTSPGRQGDYQGACHRGSLALVRPCSKQPQEPCCAEGNTARAATAFPGAHGRNSLGNLGRAASAPGCAKKLGAGHPRRGDTPPPNSSPSSLGEAQLIDMVAPNSKNQMPRLKLEFGI